MERPRFFAHIASTFLVVGALLFFAPAWANPCLPCHNGGAESLSDSVHKDIPCTGCHAGYVTSGHMASPDRSGVKGESVCIRCHLEHRMHRADDIHYSVTGQGPLPGCIDCHGSHAVPSADGVGGISEPCIVCHAAVFADYRRSVHGQAVLEGGIPGAAACTGCHMSHARSRLKERSSEVCLTCHADEPLMASHALGTVSGQSYFRYFHRWGMVDAESGSHPCLQPPGCTDCHGKHLVRAVLDVYPFVMKKELAARCDGCHPVAAEEIPDQWLPHYTQSPGKAWLVLLVSGLYRGLAGLMAVGFVLHIFVHAYRYLVGR